MSWRKEIAAAGAVAGVVVLGVPYYGPYVAGFLNDRIQSFGKTFSSEGNTGQSKTITDINTLMKDGNKNADAQTKVDLEVDLSGIAYGTIHFSDTGDTADILFRGSRNVLVAMPQSSVKPEVIKNLQNGKAVKIHVVGTYKSESSDIGNIQAIFPSESKFLSLEHPVITASRSERYRFLPSVQHAAVLTRRVLALQQPPSRISSQ